MWPSTIEIDPAASVARIARPRLVVALNVERSVTDPATLVCGSIAMAASPFDGLRSSCGSCDLEKRDRCAKPSRSAPHRVFRLMASSPGHGAVSRATDYGTISFSRELSCQIFVKKRVLKKASAHPSASLVGSLDALGQQKWPVSSACP